MRKSLIITFTIFIFLTIGKKAEMYAQPSFSMDTTFQPFFDLRQPVVGGPTSDLWENPINGNLHITGNFRYFIGNNPYYSIISSHRNGSRNYNFIGFGGSGYTFIYPFNDSVLILGTGGGGGIALWTSKEIPFGSIGFRTTAKR